MRKPKKWIMRRFEVLAGLCNNFNDRLPEKFNFRGIDVLWSVVDRPAKRIQIIQLKRNRPFSG